MGHNGGFSSWTSNHFLSLVRQVRLICYLKKSAIDLYVARSCNTLWAGQATKFIFYIFYIHSLLALFDYKIIFNILCYSSNHSQGVFGFLNKHYSSFIFYYSSTFHYSLLSQNTLSNTSYNIYLDLQYFFLYPNKPSIAPIYRTLNLINHVHVIVYCIPFLCVSYFLLLLFGYTYKLHLVLSLWLCVLGFNCRFWPLSTCSLIELYHCIVCSILNNRFTLPIELPRFRSCFQ